MTDLFYWIALSRLQDIGPVVVKKLLSIFGTPASLFDAQLNDLLAIEGIGPKKARTIMDFSSWDAVEQQLDLMEQKGIKAVHLEDPSYPEMLRQIDEAPLVLYTRGDIHPDDRFAIAIVGSRKTTPYGITVAGTIAEELAFMGFTIVSGLARGVDSLSHRGALSAGGRTLAVLGSGIDVPYPPENKGLMEHIAGSGCLISEFVPGTLPERENFPRRNRIISGLSMGVLVIEAARNSGALITAHYALEYGRDVFAVPGNITSHNSYGTNDLIRRGAILTRSADDIIRELAPVLKGFIKSKEKVTREITEEEQKLCVFLSGTPKQVDSISRDSGLPTPRVLGMLLGLELKGAVKQITGKRFYLA
jgi:DNA processing protein